MKSKLVLLFLTLFLTACATRQNVVLDFDVHEMAKHYHESLNATRRLATLEDEEVKLLKDGDITQADLDLFRLVYMMAKAYHIENVSQQAALNAAWAAVRQEVKENGKVTEREFEAFAIDGFLASLDSYSHFYDFSTNYKGYENLEIGSAQFGALMSKVDTGLEIIALQREGIAYKNKLQVGDILLRANGYNLSTLNERDGQTQVLNFYSSKMVLKLLRDGQEISITIPRQSHKRPKVFDWDWAGGVAVMRLLSFDDDVAVEFAEAIEDAFYESDGKVSGFVLDFRANPGGSLLEAVDILDLFLPNKASLVTMVGQHENREIFAQNPDASQGLPVVILQDAGSASASELVAGALQAHKRGVIIGQKSYGKDVAQSLISLKDRRGAITLTTSRYFLPLGESVKGGLQPDKLVADDPTHDGDEQLKAALELIQNMASQERLLLTGS